MEIKRKKITQKEIFKNEQNLAKNITGICQNKNDVFRTIGYELDLEFGQKENEHQSRFDILSNDENKKFESGYVSRAVITVKRQKTEKEKMEALQLESENRALLSATEDVDQIEQLQSDENLPDPEDENKRSVAFTRVMLVRAYKSFWTEWVSLTDDLMQLEDDLNEFFEVLSKRQEGNG